MIDRILGLARLSLTSPREAAAEVRRLPIAPEAAWQAGILVIVLSAILTQLSNVVLPPVADTPIMPVLVNPLLSAGVQLAIFVVTVVATFRIGRSFGGTGSFEDTLKIVVWTQVMMFLVQVVQLAALLLVPPLAVLISFASVVLFFWLFANFVAALHGFESTGMVLLGIVLSAFGLIVVFSLLLAFISMLFPGVIPSV
jgi:hypothetical protein